MKLSKTLVVPLVGLLLVFAAGAALATTGSSPVSSTGGVIPAASTPSPTPSAATLKPARETALDKVLKDLVTKGTITAAQRTAILDALTAERATRQADRKAAQAGRKAAQAERKALQQKIKGFLSDGVITKDELDQLPANHPLRQMTALMADGKITLDELKSLGRGWAQGLGIGKGGHWIWVPNASASPATGG